MRQVLAVDVPPGQLMALAGVWDLRRGDHPRVARHLQADLQDLTSLPRFPSLEQWAQLAPLHLPLNLVTHGHHVVRDAGPLAALTEGVADEYPLAPVFVRDLAGRVIHTGLDPLPSPPETPVFPVGCADVTADTPGAEALENALFVALRRLEVGPGHGVALAGQPEVPLQVGYPQPQQVPYKLRPDTFYQDGWRLPQVPRVFARAVAPAASASAVQAFMGAWEAWLAISTNQGDYEAFYEHHGGGAWFEELFLQGCTVIPTIEAYNGLYRVGDDFSVQDVTPGRAVPGLHTVVDERASDLPPGTIMGVRKPGYVTAQQVVPAEVVVSDGSAYVPLAGPAPLHPDLTQPHPRLAPATWQAVWLPTHPSHFTEPALWDWQPTGHFAQISGPVWDPLHYVYASTPALVRTTTKPHLHHPHVHLLPDTFRTRFHPVVPLTWVDVINEVTAAARPDTHPWSGSRLDTIRLAAPVTPVAYHPLPAVYEPELAPDVFPELQPAHRAAGLGVCPQGLTIAPVAQPQIPEAIQPAILTSTPLRHLWQALMQPSQPQALPVLLPDLPSSQIQLNVKRWFANRHYRRALAGVSATLGAGLFHARESALAWRRLRYRLVGKYLAAYIQAWNKGLDLDAAEHLLAQLPATAHATARAQLQAWHKHLAFPQVVEASSPKPSARAGATPLPVGRAPKEGQGLPRRQPVRKVKPEAQKKPQAGPTPKPRP